MIHAEDRELMQQAARVEALLGEIESFPDPAIQAKATEIVQGLVALYGEGIARMLAIVGQCAAHPGAGTEIVEAFAGDELISHLLILHDLHPVDVETRVARALNEVRPYLQSHGGNVELLGVQGGVARLRLQGSCHGCPSSTITLKLAIEEAIKKAAPDLEGIDAEGVAEAPPPQPSAQGGSGFVPVSTVRRKEAGPADASSAWTVVEGLPALTADGITGLEVAGRPVLFCQVEGAFYAYHNACPGCGQSLEQGILHGADLACLVCAHHYDVRRAGRCLDVPALYLQPVPLLLRDGVVKVACPQAASV